MAYVTQLRHCSKHRQQRSPQRQQLSKITSRLFLSLFERNVDTGSCPHETCCAALRGKSKSRKTFQLQDWRGLSWLPHLDQRQHLDNLIPQNNHCHQPHSHRAILQPSCPDVFRHGWHQLQDIGFLYPMHGSKGLLMLIT